jgi:hypothetical protein
MRPTLYAIFPDRDRAVRAFGALLDHGARESDVTLTAPEGEDGALLSVTLEAHLNPLQARQLLVKYDAIDVHFADADDEINYTSEQPIPLSESPYAPPEELGFADLVEPDKPSALAARASAPSLQEPR